MAMQIFPVREKLVGKIADSEKHNDSALKVEPVENLREHRVFNRKTATKTSARGLFVAARRLLVSLLRHELEQQIILSSPSHRLHKKISRRDFPDG